MIAVDIAPQITDALTNTGIGAGTIGVGFLIARWYRQQTTDAEVLYSGRIDLLRADFDAYRGRTDAELARHRLSLDECHTRETRLMVTEQELRAEVAALRAAVDRIDTGEHDIITGGP